MPFFWLSISLTVALSKPCVTIKWAFKRLRKSMKLLFLLKLYLQAVIKLGIADRHHWNVWCSISRVIIFKNKSNNKWLYFMIVWQDNHKYSVMRNNYYLEPFWMHTSKYFILYNCQPACALLLLLVVNKESAI